MAAPAHPLPGLVHLPAAPDGWQDIVAAFKSAGIAWPESAMRTDVLFLWTRCAVQGREPPTKSWLASRWGVHERVVTKILTEVGGLSVGDLLPTDGDVEVVTITPEERALLEPMAPTISQAIRLCIALTVRPLCPSGGSAAPESRSGQGPCPSCGAFVVYRDGKIPAHDKAPKVR